MIISEQISECSECMQLFHENRKIALGSSPSALLENWNVKRQESILADSITAYNFIIKVGFSTASFKEWRSKIILIVFELLNFPQSLEHHTIGNSLIYLF